MWWWIIPVVAVLLVLIWIIRAGGVYKKVFADSHFQEVVDSLPALKQAARERPIRSKQDAPQSAADPRSLLTSAGLALVYTVSPDANGWYHHLSVSLPARGYTTHA